MTSQTRISSGSQESGFSLVEVVIAGAILSIIALGSASFFANQQKMNNFVEYRAKKVQLQNSISGMFLNNPDNCRCLFQGTNNFPIGGTAALTGASPMNIGRYQWGTPGNCATATMPQPWITAAGVDDMRTESIRIVDVATGSSGVYSASLEVRVRSTKEVNGPALTQFRIPIIVNTTPVSPSQVAFLSCANEASGVASGLDYSPSDGGTLDWQTLVLARSGAPTISIPDAPPGYSSRNAGGYHCGPIVSVTLTNPAVTASTRGAILTGYTQNSGEGSPAVRFYTSDNHFVGMLGQVGRSGDGRAFGIGGDIYIPLTNRSFRLQGCRNIGNQNPPFPFNFAVKAVYN